MKKFKLAVLTVCMLAFTQAFASTEKIKVEGAVGQLSTIIQKPELKAGEKCPVVILMHGFMGNKAEEKGMMKDIADKLEANGVASIRFDFNGHGESDGKFEDMTVLNEIEDAKKMVAYAESLDYCQSVSLLGHSQGGVVTSMTAGQLGTTHVKCAVFMAPAAVLREDALRGSTFGKQYDAANPPESVDLFGPFKLGRQYILTAQHLPIYETAAQYRGPVCVIHGMADRLVPYTFGVCYHRELLNAELHLLENEDHGFSVNTPEAVSIAVGFLLNHIK